jgi:hypothetical protein
MFSVLLAVILLAALQVSTNCLHGTDFYDRSLVKRASKAGPFEYTNLLSPLNWANLNPSYAN